MTSEIETLKAIKERETEAQKRLESAAERGSKIVSAAVEEAKRIISEAEESSRRLYEAYLKESMQSASAEIEGIRKRFEAQAAKLKRDISRDVVEKMAKIVMENDE